MLLLATACSSPCPPPAPIPVQTLDRREPSRPEASLVQDLDRGIQARFRELRPEDIAVGRLGVSRVATIDRVDRGLIHPELKTELRTMDGITKAGWDSALYVVEGLKRGREAGSLTGPIVSREDLFSRFKDPSGVREVAARAMSSKAPEQGAASGVAFEARPLLASEASCLRCHRRNQVGDALGAVVYAFRSPPLLNEADR
jgi:hypothetical protein